MSEYIVTGWELWPTSNIPALKMLKQEGHELEASLNHEVNSVLKK